MNIYIDESGDLGLGKKSGRYFIVGIVSVKNPREIDIWMRRIGSKKQKKKQRKLSEIKANIASKAFNDYFFRHLENVDFETALVIIDKLKIPKNLKKEQGLIYFHMIKKGIANLIEKSAGQILITIDRRHFQKLSKDGFNTALKEFLLINCKTNSQIKIHHIDSTTNRLLQFVDFVVYAVNRKYNSKDNSWYRYLRKFIRKEMVLNLANKK